MSSTLGQRLRRFLLDGGSRRLDFRHPAARVIAGLAALGAVAALGTAAWMAWVDARNVAAPVNDPRPVYVGDIHRKIQSATEAALAARPAGGATGSPVVLVRVNYRGELISATIKRPSGNAALDELALRIVRETAPYEPFSLEMRRTTNIVEISSEFNFR